MPRSMFVAAASIALFGAAGCQSDSSDRCRLDPVSCDGEAGSFCSDDGDCIGVCCTEKSNCRSGMCTFPCKGDGDCPADMACEHDVCFYRCTVDADCAVGQSCEHGHTICEWP